MPTVEVDLPALHATQRQVVAESHAFNVLCCGRRWGKTLLATTRPAQVALQGYPVGIVQPDITRFSSDTFRELVGVLSPVTIRLCLNKRSGLSSRVGDRSNAGHWTTRTLAGHGRYKHVVIDEAAHIPNLEAAFNGSIRPTLTDLQGSADLISTPKGRGFFYRCWCRGQDPEQPDWQRWRFPSSTNPILPPEEIEAARTQLPDRIFRQRVPRRVYGRRGRSLPQNRRSYRTEAAHQRSRIAHSGAEQADWEDRRRYGHIRPEALRDGPGLGQTPRFHGRLHPGFKRVSKSTGIDGPE